MALRYSKSPVDDEAAYQKKLQVTQTYFKPDMKVLELGCGTGSTAIVHAPHVKHILAIDISKKMLEIAKAKAAAKSIHNITFQQMSIDELSVANHSFDVVLGLSILHLVESKEEVIEKVHKILKPGGIFVTSTMCLGDNMKYVKLIAPVGRFFGLMPLVNVFTKNELEGSLTKADFSIDYRWHPDKGKALFIIASTK